MLETDAMATVAVGGAGSQAIGDALLASFGSGNTVNANCSGALLTNNKNLADAVAGRVATWPLIDDADEEAEELLTQSRRSLRALGMTVMNEQLLAVDVAHLRRAFNPRTKPLLSVPLSSSSSDANVVVSD